MALARAGKPTVGVQNKSMKLTKLEHAALVLEIDGNKLVVDPGGFTPLLTDTTNIAAVVITHEHADHWTPEQLSAIRDDNPDVVIFGPEGVARAATEMDVTVVHAGDTTHAGPFTLRFFGGQHAVIHQSIPVVDNLGVLINDNLYYAGDSFSIPEAHPVTTLAVPSGGPWMKLAEAMDYVLAIAPKRSFTTHEKVLSEQGQYLSNTRIGWATEQNGGEFIPLQPGDSVEV